MISTPQRNIAVLGSTGSIGVSTLDVIANLGSTWQAWGLSAHRQLDLLCQQAGTCSPRQVVAADEKAAAKFAWSDLPRGIEVRKGPEALIELASCAEIDTVIAAIVGSAGLESSLAAVRSGKRLGLANKEAMVVAGPLMVAAAAESGAEILPVDSEHSAIFQALLSGKPSEVSRIVLTASGGPFRTWPTAKLASATIDDALAHPTWQMGQKITIDSATMMNKALEVIEARWLFQIPAEKIQVVVHPQSIVHSMVEFNDGSVLAQLSPPDMRLPIQYALTFPHRNPGPARKMDWSATMQLEFHPVDFERFPALELGFQVARDGGTSGSVLNAANEAAVDAFLNGKIRFTDIPAACRSVLEQHTFDPSPTLTDLMRLDRWARQEIARWIGHRSITI